MCWRTWGIVWMSGKLHVMKHFMMVVTSVATGGAPVTNILLLNMCIQVTFHRLLSITTWTLELLLIVGFSVLFYCAS